MTKDDIMEELDFLISNHIIDRGRVEDGWLIRGFLDYISNEVDPPGPEYNGYYRFGRQTAREMLEDPEEVTTRV